MIGPYWCNKYHFPHFLLFSINNTGCANFWAVLQKSGGLGRLWILGWMGVPRPHITAPSSMLLVGACLLGEPAQYDRCFLYQFLPSGRLLTDTFHDVIHSCVGKWAQLCSYFLSNSHDHITVIVSPPFPKKVLQSKLVITRQMIWSPPFSFLSVPVYTGTWQGLHNL